MCLWCLHMLHPKVLYPTHTRYIYAYINIPPPLLPVPFLFIILLCSTWMGILSGRRETSCNLSRYRHFHIEKIDRNQRWRSPPRSFFSPLKCGTHQSIAKEKKEKKTTDYAIFPPLFLPPRVVPFCGGFFSVPVQAGNSGTGELNGEKELLAVNTIQ